MLIDINHANNFSDETPKAQTTQAKMNKFCLFGNFILPFGGASVFLLIIFMIFLLIFQVSMIFQVSLFSEILYGLV